MIPSEYVQREVFKKESMKRKRMWFSLKERSNSEFFKSVVWDKNVRNTKAILIPQ